MPACPLARGYRAGRRAGIQESSSLQAWIPAFAGMTKIKFISQKYGPCWNLNERSIYGAGGFPAT